MSSLLSSLGCCFWWLLVGALIGWLLNRWLSKGTSTKTLESVSNDTPPAAKAANIPAASTPVTKAAAVKPKSTTKPKAKVKAKATAKPKVATKSKAVAKPKAGAKKAVAKPKATTKPKTTAKKATIDLVAAKAAGLSLKNASDLTVIEGVGPKINELFKDNGLKTFAQVSTASVTKMRAVLDKGGARYRIANPSTWAKQAKLASNNKWKELKKLQDELAGGVKK